MTAPEPHERRNRHDKPGSRGNPFGIFADETQVVVDVLDDVHQEHQIGIRPIDRTSKQQRLACAHLIAVFKVTSVDARRRPRAGGPKKRARNR
jgi:hypothetical protein